MFTANLNVFIAVMGGTSYLLSWLLEIPPSMIHLPYGASLVVTLALAAAVLLFIWCRWSLVPGNARAKRRGLYVAGQIGVAISSAVFIGGLVMSLQAAAINKEEAAWSWVAMLFCFGPVGAICLTASMALLFMASTWRTHTMVPGKR